MRSGERMVRTNGVDLCVETFGDPGDPAILLIMGAGASMLGMSMGTAIGQLMALDHPDRVASLVLACSTPGGPGHESPDLPPM